MVSQQSKFFPRSAKFVSSIVTQMAVRIRQETVDSDVCTLRTRTKIFAKMTKS